MQYDANGALLQTVIPGLPEPKRGKVRDIFDLGDSLLMVASDRISAFDVVLPNGIPNKGKVLTSISAFWFEHFDWMPNHIISTNVNEYPDALKPYAKDLEHRSMLVKKCQPMPVECVARGYLIGSGWKDYQKTGSVCGIALRAGYQQASKLENAIFTPAFKAEQGEHDENITYARTVELCGAEHAAILRERTLELYSKGAEYALTKNIIIADIKFEFGIFEGEVILIDEVLTPDSSRFWPAEKYEVGKNPPSLDKQYVRDYLDTLDWNKTAPGPELPKDVVTRTSEKYLQAYAELTGRSL